MSAVWSCLFSSVCVLMVCLVSFVCTVASGLVQIGDDDEEDEYEEE